VAVISGQFVIAKLLIEEYGADMHAELDDGRTLFHIASEQNNIAFATYMAEQAYNMFGQSTQLVRVAEFSSYSRNQLNLLTSSLAVGVCISRTSSEEITY
jgi:ankyrin repeat protein